MTTRHDTSARTKLLEAALHLIRAKGYSATSVDDLCREAGVTKGALFHHFKSKEELAVAAAEYFSEMAAGLFASAPYRHPADPRDRVLAYVDFRIAILRGELPEYTCLLGTMVQEAYDSSPLIREACERGITAHATDVARDIAEAKAIYAPEATWDPQGVALFTQAAIQGAFILAKSRHDPQVAADCLRLLRSYLDLLLHQHQSKGETEGEGT